MGIVCAGRDEENGTPSGPGTAPSAPQTTKGSTAGLVALGLLGVAALVSIRFLDVRELGQELEGFLSSSGPEGPLAYIAVYTGATVALLPASVLTLVAGYVYGPVKGTAIVSLASTLGATLSLLVSRYLARPWVQQQILSNPQLRSLDQGISDQGAKIVFLLRLSPLVPFNLLNYALGATNVGVTQYMLASWAGMLPGTFAYVYLGSLGRTALDVAAGGGGQDWVKTSLYVVGALATLWVSKVIADVAGRALKEGKEDEVVRDGP